MKITKTKILALSAVAVLGVCFSAPAKAQDMLIDASGHGIFDVPLYSTPGANDPNILVVPLYSMTWKGNLQLNNAAATELSGQTEVRAELRPNSTGGYDIHVEATDKDGLVVPLYNFPDVVRGGACLPTPR